MSNRSRTDQQATFPWDIIEKKRAAKLALLDALPSAHRNVKGLLRALDSVIRDNCRKAITMKRLAHLMGASPSTTRRAVNAAELSGFVVVERTGQSASIYSLCWKSIFEAAPGFVVPGTDAENRVPRAPHKTALRPGHGGWPFEVTARDLYDSGKVQALYEWAEGRHWIPGCTRLTFFAVAVHARVKGSQPPKLFTHLVKTKAWARQNKLANGAKVLEISNGDEDEARKMIRQLDGLPRSAPDVFNEDREKHEQLQKMRQWVLKR